MAKEKFVISVPVWIQYTISAVDVEEAIEIAKFKISMSHKGVLSDPHYDLLRYFTIKQKGE